MTADVNQDRRVTGVTQGIKLPVLSDGSRLFWALPSPVHEELGYGPSCPTGYKVMRCLPYRSFTARSRITSCRLCRDHPSRPRKPRAVLAAVKAWPGNLLVCGSITATASLTAAARGASANSRSGRRNASVEQRNWARQALLAARPEFLPHPPIRSS